ncbi:MarC family protein [Myxosarcina sp. GI1]|uniref:MarC family protein n=1 Tax=Myxosarcina sp. GI1 TaxID=1541065 RepID=UPI00055CE176|nr:MarC family protein [Myxosarcina sp. GI1]
MLELSEIFTLFFITLGPLKTIGAFVQQTRGAAPGFCRTVALRATAIATIITVVIAIVGINILGKWGVSTPAVGIAGGIILFNLALSAVNQSFPPKPKSTDSKSISPPSLDIAIFPLAIPTIVTAPGIAAIVAIVALAQDEGQPGLAAIIGLLLVIMVLNLIFMLLARQIFKVLPPPVLQIIGWVFAVLQSALAVQFIINSLRAIGALPKITSNV